MPHLISVHNLSYHHPDGICLFEHFNFSLQKEKIGIVGQNGIGKSTLFKLITQELKPSYGHIFINGKVSYLPQNMQQFLNQKVAEILNVSLKLVALKHADQGCATTDDLNVIENDWDLLNQIAIVLDEFHLPYLGLDRFGSSLSGGELMRVLLARMILEKPDLILMDEPTNNLDFASKMQFYESLQSTNVGMLIISHDRELLNRMDTLIEISNLGLRVYGGNFDFYIKERKIEDDAAVRELQNAELSLKKQEVLFQSVKDKQQHKSADGKKRAIRTGMSAIERKGKIQSAQKTTARLNDTHEEKLNQVKNQYEKITKSIRTNYQINIDLEKNKIPDRKKMIVCKGVNYKHRDSDQSLWKHPLEIEVIGSARIAIVGKNGSGKTTLVHLITKKIIPTCGDIFIGSKSVALLDQNCSLLTEDLNVFENMKRFAPIDMKEHNIRIRAGRFLFYGDEIYKKVSILSGGERLRAALACLLAMDNAPDIFILDEPTNNLDLNSIDILAANLNQYSGTLIVISHDEYFLNEINIERKIELIAF